MAVKHGVTDSDKHFVIDPVTRTIKNQSGKLVLIQYDHNSERFTFECPRYVDGHDMSECNKVEIHFINTGTGNAKNDGIYESKDLKVPDDNADIVTFSWLISQNATKYVGKLNFVVRFSCVTTEVVDGETISTVDYAWNTGIYSDIAISKSIYNGEVLVEDYVDVLEAWKQDLYSEGLKIASVKQTTTSTESGGTNIVTMTMTDGSTNVIKIQNGAEGKDGSDGTTIESIERTSGDGSPGTIDTYTITLSDGMTSDIQVYNGVDGTDGVSVTSFERTSGNGSSGSTDTYVMTLSDGTTSTFQIYNGVDGADGADGLLGITQAGVHLNDITTNVTYKLYVQNGELVTEELADVTEPIGAGGLIFTEVGTNKTYKVYIDNGVLMVTPTGEVVEGMDTVNTANLLEVNIVDTETGFSADHTYEEIAEHLNSGGYTYVRYGGTIYNFQFLTSGGAVYCRISKSGNYLSIYTIKIGPDGEIAPQSSSALTTRAISDSVSTDSSDTVASSKAVKIAYDKAVEAVNSSGNTDSFYAICGTTTNAEIEAAYSEGKKIYCITENGGVCPLYERYGETVHCFYKGAGYFYCMNNSWTEYDCPYEGVSNKLVADKGNGTGDSITADSTDEKYPSAKLVYDFVTSTVAASITASITGAIEGSY